MVRYLETVSEVAYPKPFRNNLGMEFVYIPPGTFMMGSPEDEPGRKDDENMHKVILTRGFYMQTTQVTQGQWESLMGDNLGSIGQMFESLRMWEALINDRVVQK